MTATTIHDPRHFKRQGFVHLPAVVGGRWLAMVDAECQRVQRRAAHLLERACTGTRPTDWAGHYMAHPADPIVVAEAAQPRQVCRVEGLAAASPTIGGLVVPMVAARVAAVVGQAVVLFKDKCNFKRPGGGAFAPHQDITAYRHFAAPYHVTAALPLDAATAANGCLEMAAIDRTPSVDGVRSEMPSGAWPMLPSHEGGARHGDIIDEFAAQLRWVSIPACPGDLILFDSFVPHRSAPNRTRHDRRILFFTFNLARDGDHYADYYRRKRADPLDPIFHVSTPTVHRDAIGDRATAAPSLTPYA